MVLLNELSSSHVGVGTGVTDGVELGKAETGVAAAAVPVTVELDV